MKTTNISFLTIFSDESGWWTGRLPNGQEGFFPGAYVRKI